MRSGVIARKVGMSRRFTSEGRVVPLTVLHLDACEVVSQRTLARDGYTALQLGAGDKRADRTSKPLRGHFARAGVVPKAKVAEFRVSEDALIEVGARMRADHFVCGQRVDATGTSNGKGFQGVMKRHNHHGQRASHGVSVSHRSPGSTGQCQDPGRVFKGKKMAGQMGARRATVQNLAVHDVDPEAGIILIEGSVPGHKGSWILLHDAVKARSRDDLPLPGSFAPREEMATQTQPQKETDGAASKDAETSAGSDDEKAASGGGSSKAEAAEGAKS